MYIPPAFRQDDIVCLQQAIQASRLASLISYGEDGLQVSHLPLLLEPAQGPNGTLYGHLARANPQWRALQKGAEVLVIFQLADAYISPSWYASKAEHGKVVPTWNYVAVHAQGQAQVFEDGEALRSLLSRLTARHEGTRAQPWALEDAPQDYIDAMLRGMVGFSLPISRLQGKWKLGQNRSAADQHSLREALNASCDARDQALAAYLDSAQGKQ
jgi:transcriptional regulator